MYDLVLKGGTVRRSVHGARRRAGRGGAGRAHRAHRAGHRGGRGRARHRRRRARSSRPGLIDLHAHVFEGVNRTGVNPGPRRRATRASRPSSTRAARGRRPSAASRATSCPHCHTEVIPFLHICQTGLATMPGHHRGEQHQPRRHAEGAATSTRGLIRGIKARMVSPALEIMGMEMPRLAKRAARESGIRLMVHIGDTEKRYDPKVIRSLLPLLEHGRHPHALLHRQPRRRARRQRQAGAGGARGAPTAACGSTPRTGG